MPNRTLLDVLGGRPVRGVSGSFTIASVCHRLRDYGIGALVVMKARRLVGIITERDIAIRVVAGHRDPMLTLVREVMTPDPRTIDAGACLAEAHRLMIDGGFRHLPVMRGDDVVGVISLRDIPAVGDPAVRAALGVPALG